MEPRMLLRDLPPITPQPKAAKQPHPRPWLKGSEFGEFLRPIDDKDRVRIMTAAEALERRTKRKGKRDGAVGQSALTILRAMLFHFLDPKRGQLDPSYKRIQKQTGFCMQTISRALKRLRDAGILEIKRRTKHVRDYVQNAWTGRYEWRLHIRQTSNAYMLNNPLCDRNEFGDLGMPLFRPDEKIPASDSTSKRESTPRILTYRDAALRRRAWQVN
jgi:hypothetical protein